MYENREQTEAKHAILRRYLMPFAQKILRGFGSLDFIDGFSGPWENRDQEGLTDTSIGIALETLSSAVENVRGEHPNANVRCIFNELKAESFALLADFVERRANDFPLIDIEIFEGSFEENASKIRSASTNNFRLLFVDPTGYTGFSPAALAKFKGRNTELFVNFMRSFVVRFVTGNHADREAALVRLVGETRARYLLDTGLTIDALEDEFLKMLRADLGYKYSGLSPIHNPDRDEIHFNLMFATNHPEGMEVMRTAEFRALSDHDQKRYEVSTVDTGDNLFSFAGEELETFGPYLTTRRDHRDSASEELKRLLAANPSGLVFSDLAANLQQKLFLRRTELADEIVALADHGRIKATWRDHGRRKPGKSDPILKED